MSTTPHSDVVRHWQESVRGFVKLGVTAYGGPAIMGLMHAELQEKRPWVTRERCVEGLSFVNMVPGTGATQLGIFLGHTRGGWWGSLLAGLCFALPACGIMLALTMTYAHLGATPLMRGGLYGLGPVVLGICVVAVSRRGRSTGTTVPQLLIAITAAAAAAWSPLGIAVMLALAAGVGIWLLHACRVGAVLLMGLTTLAALYVALGSPTLLGTPAAHASALAPPADLPHRGLFFCKVGALTFGGGLTMLAFIQEQVVHQLHWLTPHEFLDGLALGQYTPGPMVMVAAYVGYTVTGMAGAAVAAAAVFGPLFVLMFSMLPVFERVRTLVWIRAAMRGVGPAVIGVMAVFLVRMAPHALPDLWTMAILLGTLIAFLAWRLSPLTRMEAGAVVGVVRSRWWPLPGVRAAR